MHAEPFCPSATRAAFAVLVFASTGAAAQNTPRGAVVPELEGAIEDRSVSMTLIPPIKSEKASEWFFLPIPKASPAIGGGLQLVVARFFQIDAKSQPSVVDADSEQVLSSLFGRGRSPTLISMLGSRWLSSLDVF